jgi:hypothetical protein
MRSTVDVWVAADAAAALAPPPRSLVAGGSAPVDVRTYAIRRPLQRPVAITLAVDEPTARRLERTGRWQAVWLRWICPAVLVLAVLVAPVVFLDSLDRRMPYVTGWVLPVLAVAVVLERLLFTLSASAYHPRLNGRGTVVIRGVERGAAYAWARLNPPGAVRLVE